MAAPVPSNIYDANLELKAAGLIAVTTNHTTLNLGAKGGMMKAVLDISACEISSNDELYKVIVQGSPDSGVTWYNLAIQEFGATEVLDTDPDTTPGAEVIYFNNIRRVPSTPNDLPQVLDDIRLRTVVSGTVATGINYEAWVSFVGHGG